MRIVSNASIT